MSVARDIAALGALISTESELDLFAPDALHRLYDTPACGALLRSLGQQFPEGITGQALLLALQALRVQSVEAHRQLADAEFVATLPSGFSRSTRATTSVVYEMIDAARCEVLALGYEINEVEVIRRLVAAASRGCRVTLICDRARGSGQEIARTWPMWVTAPRIFENRPCPGAAAFSSMHCKTVLVDSRDLLVTSANLTFHGLNANLEFGVRLRGPRVQDAQVLFAELLASGVLVELEASGDVQPELGGKGG